MNYIDQQIDLCNHYSYGVNIKPEKLCGVYRRSREKKDSAAATRVQEAFALRK